jgi:DNA-binding NtrC family response regulator
LRDDSRYVGGQQASILLVDDDIHVLNVLARMLERAGHQVFACDSAEEAQRHLTKGLRPSLLISDVALGTSTGKRIAESVQRQSPKTRVIFISGYSNIAVGGQPVLQKPFSSKELIELVDQVLSADTQSGAHRLESEFAASRKKH